MTGLYIQLFGRPKVLLNGQEIIFPFAKINALLYYLVLNGTVSREKMANLLWEDKDLASSRKNLRNTIYQANKLLGEDYIICPTRHLITLNKELPLTCDALLFSEHTAQSLELYRGDFLQGFYIKQCEEYDLWIDSTRQHFEQLYITTCHHQLESGELLASFEESERHIKHLISIDEFEEQHYQLLMKLYLTHHRPQKVIQTYYQLANLLEKDLGISPSPESQQLYDKVLEDYSANKHLIHFLRQADYFFGRTAEIQVLEGFLADILHHKQSKTFLLIGGTGIGKRTLIRQVLANQTSHYHILTAQCFQEEINRPKLLWEGMISTMQEMLYSKTTPLVPPKQEGKNGDYDSLALSQELINMMTQLCQDKPLILLIEDSHWLPEENLSVLKDLHHHLRQLPVAFVLTKHLSTPKPLNLLLQDLALKNRIEHLELQPLSHDEIDTYLDNTLANTAISHGVRQEVHYYSQGNPFLLKEYVSLLRQNKTLLPLTPAIKAKYQLKVANLSHQEEDLLAYLSCLDDLEESRLLAELLQITEAHLLSLIEQLEHKHLIHEEIRENQSYLSFDQRIIKIFYYDRLSPSQKRLLHLQIASVLEKRWLDSNQTLTHYCQKLANHYKQGQNLAKSLSYRLLYLGDALPYHHDLFPIYTRESPITDLTNIEIESLFSDLEIELEELSKQGYQSIEIDYLRMQYCFLEGRYKIRIGDYTSGNRHIHRVIHLAQKLGDKDYLLKGYRQLIHYYIQTDDLKDMAYLTETALEVAISANNHEAIAIQLRLRGLYFLMRGQFEEAEKAFQDTITTFSLTPSLQNRYALQIAAAYDYLAEISQVKKDFNRAIHYHEKALKLTQNMVSESAYITFQISLGMTYFFKNDYNKARNIFQKAQQEYQSMRYPWKETQLTVFLALISLTEGSDTNMTLLLQRRENLIARYSNPRDKGLIYYAIAFYHKLKPNHKTEGLEDFSTCYSLAKRHLNPNRDRLILEQLEQLKITP